MNPSEVIEEARASIYDQANYEDPVPKFWDTASGTIEFGVRRRASRAVLADIDANTGIYPTVHVSLLKQSHAPVGVAEQNALTRAYPELIALAGDPDSSVSLWLVSQDHVCLTHSRSRAVTRATELESEEESEKENGAAHAATQGHKSNTAHAKPFKPRTPPAEPLRLDARALFRNLAFPQVVRTSSGRRKPGARPSAADDRSDRIIRIAVDFKPPHSRSVRRTGTVVQVVTKANHLGRSETNQGPRYNTSGDMMWSVVWDNAQWFGGAWAWLGFVDIESSVDLSGGLAGSSEAVLPDNGGEDRRAHEPLLVLAWTCKNSVPPPKTKPQPRPVGRGRGAPTQPESQQDPYPEWYIVSMVGKRQEEWKGVRLTREERDALGLGRTRREMAREVDLSVKGLPSKPNWVESWSDSRFRPVVPREE